MDVLLLDELEDELLNPFLLLELDAELTEELDALDTELLLEDELDALTMLLELELLLGDLLLEPLEILAELEETEELLDDEDTLDVVDLILLLTPVDALLLESDDELLFATDTLVPTAVPPPLQPLTSVAMDRINNIEIALVFIVL